MANLKTANLKSLLGAFKTNYTMVLWVLLLVLFALEGFALKDSVMSVLNSAQPVVDTKLPSAVRVNFKDYQGIVSRMESAKTFKPSPPLEHNPFIKPVSATPAE